MQQTIVITGANRGIGLALCKVALRSGARVIAGAREPDKAKQLQSLVGADKQLTIAALDVSDTSSCESFATSLNKQPVDMLINNAGVLLQRSAKLGEIDFADFSKVMDVNTLGPLRMMQALLPNLIAAPDAKVGNISSKMGSFSEQSLGVYSYRASKAALNKCVQVLAPELKNDAISVISIHPGWVQTEMGGSGAQISVQQSADGIFKLLSDLKAGDSGKFFNYDGGLIEW